MNTDWMTAVDTPYSACRRRGAVRVGHHVVRSGRCRGRDVRASRGRPRRPPPAGRGWYRPSVAAWRGSRGAHVDSGRSRAVGQPGRDPCQGPVLARRARPVQPRSEEHTSELQSRENLVCRLLLEKKKERKRLVLCYIHYGMNEKI